MTYIRNLREVLEDARARHVAVGHFNVSNFEQFKAVCLAIQETRLPAVIGVSEGEREYLGVRQIAALVRSVREELGLELYLNADHTHTLKGVEEAVSAGFDAVLFDGGKLTLEENIRQTREAVSVAKKLSSDILVEGELGYIGSGSKLLDAIPSDVHLGQEFYTTPSEAGKFVLETGVDLLAPSVGTIHGVLRNASHSRVDVARVREIAAATSALLVLHGGSGTADADFRASVEAGVSLVHVSTELRLLWRQSLEKFLKNQHDEINPGKVGSIVIQELCKQIVLRIKLFRGM